MFIAWASLGLSLWLVVFVQALILSLLVFYYFRYFSNEKYYRRYFLAFTFFISFFTAASVTVNTIDTGMFAAVSILSLGLLLLAPKMAKRDLGIISVITVISLAINSSQLIAAMLLVPVFVGIMIAKKLLASSDFLKTRWSRISLCALLVLSASLLVACLADQVTFYRPGHNVQLLTSGYQAILGEHKMAGALQRGLGWEWRECSLSQQYWQGLSFKAIGYTQLVTAVVSIFFFIYLLFKKRALGLGPLFLLIVIACTLNLAVNAFLFTANESSGWQIIWLLTLPSILYLTRLNSIRHNDLNIL